MQNIQVQSKQEIKAILSSLRTDTVVVNIDTTGDKFTQKVGLYLTKGESMIQSELKTMLNAGFILDHISGQKKGVVCISFTKELTAQALTEIEVETS